MNKTLIGHEIPNFLFHKEMPNQEPYKYYFGHYPYILGHLLVKETPYYDEDYANFYKQEIKENGYSVMDNGLWELGDSIDYKVLYELGEEYKPSHLILPDCLNNKQVTMERTMKYLLEFEKKSTPKFMAVVQGQTLEELIQMAKFYSAIDSIDVIAIPLYSLPQNSTTLEEVEEIEYKLHRTLVVPFLLPHLGGKKLHLLGCITPDEFLQYDIYTMRQVYSIDTSAPITYGLNHIVFDPDGVGNFSKPKEKIAEILHQEITPEQIQIISHNVKMFKNFVK